MYKLYLIWRIWATTRNLDKIAESKGRDLLAIYYMDLCEEEYPQVK